jgi:hypothetical protein
MIRLIDEDTGKEIGRVTEAQFQPIVDDLEEESAEDTNYWVDSMTIEMLEEEGADPALLAIFKQTLGTREGFEVRWERV